MFKNPKNSSNSKTKNNHRNLPPGKDPLNENIEKRHDPYRDYNNQRNRNHELKQPDKDDFQFLFGDGD
ncbi:hypothetical protein BHU61_06485 [Macrococcus epidermidis]|uniref:Uncharacterized protein n=1 Tax=Macrococcus epidermidis TaxID=1902580 RepID=A0A327ZS25_9STAP|nr:hypothetical protein [Macrococcus epidermidis]RAK44957.1 hypothetical protein BHU61_06485 [Macrococcus epidermidis]